MRPATLCLLLVGANAAVWTWAWCAFATIPMLLAASMLAYGLGLRHAVDADHVAAIDNVVRKLVQEGAQSHLTGFFFSLGHSTVVLLGSAGLALAMRGGVGLHDGHWQESAARFGSLVSVGFLIVVGLFNLLIFARFRARPPAAACYSRQHLQPPQSGHLSPGILVKWLRPVFRWVSKPWHMYPVGILFGLGFDTASAVGLLTLAATDALRGGSMNSILIFPALFAAGMSLVDTVDSLFMARAYRWSMAEPVRRRRYNMVITATSAAVALIIGIAEGLELLKDYLDLGSGIVAGVDWLDGHSMQAGLLIVGVLLSLSMMSMAIHRFKEGAARSSADSANNF